MKLNKVILASLLALSPFGLAMTAPANLRGKVDVSAVQGKIHNIYSGNTFNKPTVRGGRVGATFVLNQDGAWYNGLTLKPDLMLAGGDATYRTGSISLGYTLPFWNNKLTFIPHFGGAVSFMSQRDVPHPQFAGLAVHQTFRSSSAFVGLDLVLALPTEMQVLKDMVFMANVQYCGDNTTTQLKNLPAGTASVGLAPLNYFNSNPTTSHGFNYQFAVDYYFMENTAFSVGYAIKRSKAKEKYALKGEGFKLGLAYAF